jgi:hypothetical protein
VIYRVAQIMVPIWTGSNFFNSSPISLILFLFDSPRPYNFIGILRIGMYSEISNEKK